MTSTAGSKRFKLLKGNEFKTAKNITAESGFLSENDFTSNQTTDFSLPPVKRKSPAPRRASLQQISLNTTGNNTQQSSGYSSLYSSSSNITATGSLTSLASRTSRTPKKRKSEISESDENFYNSFQFVSPVKIRKKDTSDKNCAKLVLKDKCPSANVILCSTPIRNNNKNSKWGKFRSFHPEKFQIGKSLEIDDEVGQIEKVVSTPPIKCLTEDSINLSNIDFSNLSGGNFSQSIQQDIPADIQNLWTGNIKQSKSVRFNTTESQVISVQSSINTTKPAEKKIFFNGRNKVDILGMLHKKNDIAVDEILSFLDAETLLSLSHVCKNYRHMIQNKKIYETKRQNYLKAHRSIKENKLPSKPKALNHTVIGHEFSISGIITGRKKRKAFGTSNLNITMAHLKTPSPPQSPKSRQHKEMEKLVQSNKICKKCPRCRKPATINSIKIRNSPRKKKPSTLYKLSTSTGRIQKKARTFLSKTSIPEESFHEAINSHYVTLPNFDDDSSKSPHRSSSCESPNSSGSDEPSCDTDEIYEYGLCNAVSCSFKFCIKCNCKYHPRRICGDLSPPSPSRNNSSSNRSKIIAGTKASRKSLMRLIQ